MTIRLNPVPQTPLRDDPTQDAIWKRFLQFWIDKIQTAGTGSVTSVAQTVPTEFAIAGSPITTSGTLAITKQVQNANKGWFGPTTGADAQPTFRALVTADLPSGTGTVTSVDVSGGTTGLTTSGGPITGSGTITIAGQVNLGALNPSALAFAASYG